MHAVLGAKGHPGTFYALLDSRGADPPQSCDFVVRQAPSEVLQRLQLGIRQAAFIAYGSNHLLENARQLCQLRVVQFPIPPCAGQKTQTVAT